MRCDQPLIKCLIHRVKTDLCLETFTLVEVMSYVLTAISREKVDSTTFLSLKNFIESLPIKVNSVDQLSENRVFDFKVSLDSSATDLKGTEEDLIKLRTIISNSSDSFQFSSTIDIVTQEDNELRKDKKLFCFDMDSTLIYQEVIELIAEYANVQDQVEKITTAAMNGEIDFQESLKLRVALLKGIDATIWENLKRKLEFTKGDHELMKGLKAAGCKLAVLSGGFIELAEFVKETLGLDYAFANKLATESVPHTGHVVFSGETVGEIVDGQKKAQLTKRIAEKEGIKLAQTVCVGDGSNDLPMMAVAGFGIAWNAKPRVQKLAPSKLNSDYISDIFYILGYNDEEISNLTA